jgi:Tfp pilus assembly protein PilW
MRKLYRRNPRAACAGLTIVQLMAALFMLGIVLWAAVNLFADSRCETAPSEGLCANRSGTWMMLRGR